MKKLLALLLVLIMCVGIFAACGEEKTPVADDPTDTPDTPSTPENPSDKTEEDSNIAIAYIDMTESQTLVIEKAGTVGDERIGVRCGAGKIQAGTYNTSGKKRTASWEFDFASLGLEGHSWEYLGAKVEIDTSDPTNPKIINTPVKSTFAVKTADLKFPDELTCELPNGIKIDGKDFIDYTTETIESAEGSTKAFIFSVGDVKVKFEKNLSEAIEKQKEANKQQEKLNKEAAKAMKNI